MNTCICYITASEFLEYVGAVRLVNNNTYGSSGRLEVFLNNEWGSVCFPSGTFPLGIASVVCKQLGYNRATVVSFRYSVMYIHVCKHTILSCTYCKYDICVCVCVYHETLTSYTICTNVPERYILCKQAIQ